MKLDGKTSATLKTNANVEGRWEVVLPPQAASLSPYTIFVESHNTGATALFQDVLFGDVYLCSGQSNMLMTITQAVGSQEELDKAEGYPNIRVMAVGIAPGHPTFGAENLRHDVPRFGNVDVRWSRPSVHSLGGNEWSYFSMVCWVFGRTIHDYLEGKVPIGLIHNAVGATCVESW